MTDYTNPETISIESWLKSEKNEALITKNFLVSFAEEDKATRIEEHDPYGANVAYPTESNPNCIPDVSFDEIFEKVKRHLVNEGCSVSKHPGALFSVYANDSIGNAGNLLKGYSSHIFSIMRDTDRVYDGKPSTVEIVCCMNTISELPINFENYTLTQLNIELPRQRPMYFNCINNGVAKYTIGQLRRMGQFVTELGDGWIALCAKYHIR